MGSVRSTKERDMSRSRSGEATEGVDQEERIGGVGEGVGCGDMDSSSMGWEEAR